MNEEVDVNALITLYNQKVAQLSNQVILLEAKLQTLTQDYNELKEKTQSTYE
jgi:outer membrane murein-binding lipoprotein Lpp|tara:strand:+ start:3541 stop:3696 length:156 start_codon:yes stop_codon:yes gene_type:complete